MADEALKAEFEDETEDERQQLIDDAGKLGEQEEKPEQEEPEYSESETKARAGGWVPKDEWEGDPDEWIGIGQFNRFGELIDTVKRSRAEIRRVEGSVEDILHKNNKYHEQQTAIYKRRIEELKGERRKAVDLADADEVERIQGEIDDLGDSVRDVETDSTKTTGVTETNPIIDEWESKNAWITEQTPKAAFAKSEFSRYLNDNLNDATDAESLVKGAIAATDTAIAREFPDKNPNRDKAATVARGRTTRKPSGKQLTMTDLTSDEKEMYREMGDAYKDEAEFLEAVKNARA